MLAGSVDRKRVPPRQCKLAERTGTVLHCCYTRSGNSLENQHSGVRGVVWIWRRRLEVAAKCLGDPDRVHAAIGDLAYRCGFSSQAHFSRRFKDRYGLSPRDYRHDAVSRRQPCGP
jgi:AraC-like DNA-binding protein